MTVDWNLVLGPVGLTVVLIAIGLAGLRGVWISGREHRAMIGEKDKQIAALTEDRDYWKNFGMGLLNIQERQTDAVGTIANVALRGRKAGAT